MSPKIQKVLLFGFLGLVLALLAAWVYIVEAQVVGYEFNPQTWQIRHFEFYADPITNTQLIGIDRSGGVNWVIDPAITSQLSPGSTDRWDLIELDDYRLEKSEGPAAIIVDILTSRGRGWSFGSQNFWSNWTKQNPTESSFLWKAAQSLTIHGAYNKIPELFEVAVTSTSKIPELTDKIAAEALLGRATQLQSDGETKAAKAAAIEGLKYAPKSAELQKFVDGS